MRDIDLSEPSKYKKESDFDVGNQDLLDLDANYEPAQDSISELSQQ